MEKIRFKKIRLLKGTLGFDEHPVSCKISKNLKQSLWRHKKIAKQVTQGRNNKQKNGEVRD